MNFDMFKGKCLECGKEMFVIKRGAKVFCSKMCEKNYAYRKRFITAPEDKRRTPEEVKRL